MTTDRDFSLRTRRFLLATLTRLGVTVRHQFRSAVDVSTKSNHHDILTDLDSALQQQLSQACLEFLPDSQVFGEEDYAELSLAQIPDEFARALQSSPVWIIDPIDGTSNFVHGFGFFAISVALWADGDFVASAVYNPVTGEMFSADVAGAYTQQTFDAVEEPLSPAAGRTQRAAALTTSFPHAEILTDSRGLPLPAASEHLEVFAGLVHEFASVRRPICASLELCYVAAGYSDATLAVDSKPWDAAAGAFIATQAGAVFAPHWYGPQPDLPAFAAPCYTAARGNYPALTDAARRIAMLQTPTP